MPSSSRYCSTYPASPKPSAVPRPAIGLHRDNGVETVWRKDMQGRPGRYVEGIASTPTINSHGYSLASKGCLIQFPIPLLSDHGRAQTKFAVSRDMEQTRIGDIIEVRRSDFSIRIVAVLDDGPAAAHAWRLIQDGTARCFSGAGTDLAQRGVVDGSVFYTRWRLTEVSVCRAGANPDCRITSFYER